MRAFKARHFMEMAVQVMKDSIAEPRKDGKASPKVGAVLLNLDDEFRGERICTACRGELRQGDHAEYTLLERKNRDRKLDTCVLFATLEPCAPGARKPPKTSCAERIVSARIKKVWVGIEDPDPTVDRKGIKYLQDNGVEVVMFDRDLQEAILEENKDFIAQAEERAAAAERALEPVVLSQLESPIDHPSLDAFSTDALQLYRQASKLDEDVSSAEFRQRLRLQDLLMREGDKLIPTGFGLLLFGKEPRTALPQAGLLATIHYPDGTEETKDFDGPIVDIPRLAIEWLEGKMPNVIDRSTAIRGQRNDPFYTLIREGIVNALVHRDYDIRGAKCQLIVTKDVISILSPGGPVPPITVEQLQSFNAPMLSRNPVLHYVFAKIGLAEERGLGLKSMRQAATEAELPLPKYSWNAPYLVLSLFPNRSSSTAILPADVLAKLSDSERTGWQWLSTRGKAKSLDYAKAMGVDTRTARRHLSRFSELGLVRLTGAARATEYEVL